MGASCARIGSERRAERSKRVRVRPIQRAGLRAPGERAHCANLGGTAREPRPNVGRGFFVRKSRGAFEDFQRTRGRQGGYTP